MYSTYSSSTSLDTLDCKLCNSREIFGWLIYQLPCVSEENSKNSRKKARNSKTLRSSPQSLILMWMDKPNLKNKLYRCSPCCCSCTTGPCIYVKRYKNGYDTGNNDALCKNTLLWVVRLTKYNLLQHNINDSCCSNFNYFCLRCKR